MVTGKFAVAVNNKPRQIDFLHMTQLDTAILREFVEQIWVSDTYTTVEHKKRVKIRKIEIAYNFIGAFDFGEARGQSQTAQDNNK